ncbi:hypothetical protein A1D22_06015 [Pasteurellaceae bacterium LFhippo2]|nr:hypothetical protein [Pasteurellaceae bacterium LFhippo2]
MSWNIFKLRKDIKYWANLCSKQALEIILLKNEISKLKKELQVKNNRIAIDDAMANIIASSKRTRKEIRADRNRRGK